MKIRDKINLDMAGLIREGPITIVAFGDSLTHGAEAPGVLRYDTVYWERLRQKILSRRKYVPVNVINAGIGGITAARSVDRLENQVLAHRPDLIIICFLLNDVNDPLDTFLGALRTIFDRCTAACEEVIYLTPNMLNTYVDEARTEPRFLAYAHETEQMQNGGKVDLYVREAIALAKERGVTVCDCYAKWKELAKSRDTTKLLANAINHPTSEMHELFAEELFRLILPDTPKAVSQESGMYEEKK